MYLYYKSKCFCSLLQLYKIRWRHINESAINTKHFNNFCIIAFVPSHLLWQQDTFVF